MDAIDELVERVEKRFQGMRQSSGWGITDDVKRAIADELRAANITIPPSPPEPGSLWEHKETGERRFVRDNRKDNSVLFACVVDGAVFATGKDWHAWSANATCLVPAREKY